MAQQPESGRNSSGIARAGNRKWGYNPEQVDEFLERTHALYDSEDAQLTQQDIQNVSFDLCKGGYVISQVDAALGRLERAVVDRQTTREITRHGRVVWKAQTEDLYRSLAAHADRAEKQRFRPGNDKAPSYDRKQVDRLVDQIIDKAAAELGVDGVTAEDVRDLVDLNSTSVANVIFTQRKGKRGYDERQVDNYLNACVRLLSRLESYTRVADYVNDPASTQQRASAPEPSAAPALFPPRNASPSFDASSSPTVMDDDFAELHRVEQQIFSVPAAAPAATAPVTPTPQRQSPVPPSFTPAAAATEQVPVWGQAPQGEPTAPVQADPVPETQPEPPSQASVAESSAPALDMPSMPTVQPLNLESVPSLDIPDLSFPSFDSEQSAQKKPEQ